MASQTPASRKFVPPSSASAARTSSRPGFSSRFVHPSQTPSSSLPRTPFSSVTTKSREVDIDVDEFEDDEAADKANRVSRDHGQSVVAAEADGDDLPPDAYREGGRTGGQNLTQTRQTLSLPQSTIKRRKLSHFAFNTDSIDQHERLLSSSPPTPAIANDDQNVQIQIPRSSPELPDPDEAPNINRRQSHSYDSSDDLPSHDSPIKNVVTPRLKASRFRHPPPLGTPLTQHSTDQPLPSFQSRLLGATTSSLRGPHPSLDFALPDAFSPSRKKGQRDYIHGGHAETVRGWVLDVAARAGDETAQAERQQNDEDTGVDEVPLDVGRRAHGRMTVDTVLHRDRDGRFAVVRLSDVDDCTSQPTRQAHQPSKVAAVWMLINTDSPQTTRRHTSVSKVEMLRPGVVIAVKGGEAMRWSVDLDRSLVAAASSSSRQQDGIPLVNLSSRPVKDDSRCHVAVLWDIVQ